MLGFIAGFLAVFLYFGIGVAIWHFYYAQFENHEWVRNNEDRFVACMMLSILWLFTFLPFLILLLALKVGGTIYDKTTNNQQ